MTWQQFQQVYALSDQQVAQFQDYAQLLQTYNERFNLTAITDEASIISHHFADSLQLGSCTDMHAVSMLADVGTGAGFPGLALKIAYPQLKIMLIEVNQKKVAFLQSVAERLGLTEVMTSDMDWRTFIRKTDYSIDMFTARASLQVSELVRIFKPSSAYKDAQLLYFASRHWQVPAAYEKYMVKKEAYTIDGKRRYYYFFKVS